MTPGSGANPRAASRRGFLKLSATAAAALAAGCDGKGEDLLEWVFPELDELELGEVLFGWDGQGNLYELRPHDHTIARIADGGTERWVVGSADDVSEGGLNFPLAVAALAGATFAVIEGHGTRVSVYDGDGNLVDQLGEEGDLEGACDAVADADGNIYVVDRLAHQIVVFDAQGALSATLGTAGAAFGQLNGPTSIARDAEGNLHVVDAGNARVQVFTPEGAFVRSYGGAGSGEGELVVPRSISIDPLGHAWVADPQAHVLRVYHADGSHRVGINNLRIGGREIQPMRVTITPDGGVYIQANIVETEA